jgi:protein SCO1/2
VRERVALLLACLVITLSACSDSSTGAPLTARVIDPPFTVADQPLEDLDGEAFSLVHDTEARLTLVFFGYTNCPDLCGIVLGNLASALTRLSPQERDQVEVFFVTTDPARDDPATLRDYLDGYDPEFRGLTGTVEQIEAVASSIGVGLGTRLASGGYEVDAHTTNTTAIDVDGLAPVFWRQTASPAQYAADFRSLLGEG